MDTEALRTLIASYSDEELQPFLLYANRHGLYADDYPADIAASLADGWTLAADAETIERLLFVKSIHKLGYSSFMIERPRRMQAGRLCIAPLKNDLDAILWMQTAKDTFDAGPAGIIETLQRWRRYCSLRLAGAGLIWIKLDFETLPEDIAAFSESVIRFCPEIIAGSIESADDLAEMLHDERSLALYWKY